jgi:(p)ppGpp synthase/HD superfamily hydrolase
MADALIPSSDSEELARLYALQVHAQQRWGQYAYFEHVRRVHALCAELELGKVVRTAAWLHDCLEDSDKPVDSHTAELAEQFGSEVCELVVCVSGFGANRTARTADIVSKLWQQVHRTPSASAQVPAVNLKLVDRFVNWSMCQQETDVLSRKLQKLFGREFAAHYRAFLPFAHPKLRALLQTLSQRTLLD